MKTEITYERVAHMGNQQAQKVIIGLAFADPDLNEPKKV